MRQLSVVRHPGSPSTPQGIAIVTDGARARHPEPGRTSGSSLMLSASSVFEEIFRDDEAFALFCSIAASGEAQGGWENGRIGVLVPESCQDLAPKIVRHGADEDKHGRIFT